MNSYRIGLSMVALLVTTGGIAMGCGDDTTSSTATTTGTGTTTATTTTATTTTATTTTTTTGGGAGGEGGGGVGGAGGNGVGGGGVGGGGDACAPDPNDDMCISCTKEFCCDEIIACMADPACVMCLECLQNAADPITECIIPGTCSLQDPLLMCGQMNCQADCT